MPTRPRTIGVAAAPSSPACEPPSVQDCYDCANRGLDMWNDLVDHAARSGLLQMADAWLRLASEQSQRSYGQVQRDERQELSPRISQSRIELNPNVIDARMKLMAIGTALIGKRGRRGEYFGRI